MQFSQKLLFKVKKSFTKRSAWSKNFSRLAKICSPRQLFSLSLLGQNAAWTNLLPVKKKNREKTNTPLRVVKKNREKTNTPLRVVKRQCPNTIQILWIVKNKEKANNSPSYRCAAIKNIIIFTFSQKQPLVWSTCEFAFNRRLTEQLLFRRKVNTFKAKLQQTWSPSASCMKVSMISYVCLVSWVLGRYTTPDDTSSSTLSLNRVAPLIRSTS